MSNEICLVVKATGTGKPTMSDMNALSAHITESFGIETSVLRGNREQIRNRVKLNTAGNYAIPIVLEDSPSFEDVISMDIALEDWFSERTGSIKTTTWFGERLRDMVTGSKSLSLNEIEYRTVKVTNGARDGVQYETFLENSGIGVMFGVPKMASSREVEYLKEDIGTERILDRVLKLTPSQIASLETSNIYIPRNGVRRSESATVVVVGSNLTEASVSEIKALTNATRKEVENALSKKAEKIKVAAV